MGRFHPECYPFKERRRMKFAYALVLGLLTFTQVYGYFYEEGETTTEGDKEEKYEYGEKYYYGEGETTTEGRKKREAVATMDKLQTYGKLQTDRKAKREAKPYYYGEGETTTEGDKEEKYEYGEKYYYGEGETTTEGRRKREAVVTMDKLQTYGKLQ